MFSFCTLVVAQLLASGSPTPGPAEHFSVSAVAAMSPVPELVAPLEAFRRAAAYVKAHPGTDFMMGSGNSMLPLYKDHTVIITKHLAIELLKPGMTVVFIGEHNEPVAHVLVRLAPGGWISMGVGNAECDRVRISPANYVGVVVKAFQPMGNPMAALLPGAPLGVSRPTRPVRADYP